MEFLFMNQIGKKAETTLRVIDPPGNPLPEKPKKRVKFCWNVLAEQCVNSAVVAGIAALVGSWSDPWVGLKAFGLTFLIELRKYRKL